MSASRQTGGPAVVPVLHVHLPDGRVLRFSGPFRIGRDADCEVRLNDAHVSRKHLAGAFEDGAWRLRDLKSANGLIVDGRRVERATVGDLLSMTLGIDGPVVAFEVEGRVDRRSDSRASQPTVASPERETQLLEDYEQRYFRRGGGGGERAGGKTRMMLRAFERVQKKERRRYQAVVALVALAAVAAIGSAIYKHRQIQEQQALAEDIFYAMKTLDVDIANMERLINQSGSAEAREQASKYMARRREMESRYDRLAAVRKLYDSDLSEEDRLILRVTRSFGECELAAPDEYLSLVKSYIQRWRSSERFRKAVVQAEQLGFTKVIADEFQSHNLPPQFYYLAMQESDFNPFASGPPTRMGIAKGMWQFIPDTGSRYGLRIGPLQKVRQPDPEDDRHDWRKATNAAARYIKDIYATDAQASGLLVMASYNWGENRVIRLIQSMPQHPQERNFWKLLEHYRVRVPKETYDYVFNIVAAAVIGENPRLFGFDFDNPLAPYDQK